MSKRDAQKKEAHRLGLSAGAQTTNGNWSAQDIPNVDQFDTNYKPAVGSENPGYKSLGTETLRTSGPHNHKETRVSSS